MNSKEAIETAICMKESLDTGNIIEPQKQSVTMEDESISMIDTVHDLEQENKELKEQLAEKDKEIAELRQTIISLYNSNINLEMYSKTIREQVCDEIREKLKAHCDYTDEENIGWYLTEHKIDTLLDQMEQAKGEMI